MSRISERRNFTTETRVTLLETDADDIEGDVAAIQRSIQRLSSTFIAAAVTFGTSAVLLAINLTIG